MIKADEARTIANIMAYVDGQCYVCAANLAASMNLAFPEHNWYKLIADAGDWSEEQMKDPYG